MSRICDMDCFNCKFEDCIREPVCLEKNRYCNRSENAKQTNREYQKKKRAEAKSKGLCVICQKKAATHGVHCLDCWLRKKRNYQERRSSKREMWQYEGKCYFCGRDPIAGKKVCAIHYEMCKARAEHMRSFPQTKEAQRKFVEWYWKLQKPKGDKKYDRY